MNCCILHFHSVNQDCDSLKSEHCHCDSGSLLPDAGAHVNMKRALRLVRRERRKVWGQIHLTQDPVSCETLAKHSVASDGLCRNESH